MVHLWTRIPLHDDPHFRHHRELALSVCSDRIWQHPLAVDARRITYPTRRTAIEAFISGYTKIRNTQSRDHQWNFVAAIPVRLPEVRGSAAPITVGVLCVQSNLPWTYAALGESLFEGDPLARGRKGPKPFEGQGSDAKPVTTLRLAHGFWLEQRERDATKVSPHAPLDVILTGLAKSAQQLVLIPPKSNSNTGVVL